MGWGRPGIVFVRCRVGWRKIPIFLSPTVSVTMRKYVAFVNVNSSKTNMNAIHPITKYDTRQTTAIFIFSERAAASSSF